jgi:twitching motility protein PilT
MPKLDQYLQVCIDGKGSDLHIASESPVYIRQLGRLQPITEALPIQTCEELIFEILDPATAEKLKTEWEVDTSYTMANGERFRVNAYRQRKGWDAVLRHFSSRVASIDELGLPPILKKFSDANQGLILITGPGRSGKSTTCAALVNHMNQESEEHIITIEDPVEYIHLRKRSLINQRSVGPHTASFSSALRSALREDPDIIVVGEMRDTETMSLALTAAETGHLVLSTLHTNDTSQAVSRILDSFPAGNQPQIRQQLSLALLAIVAQQLVPGISVGRYPAVEILMASSGVRSLIRKGEDHQIYSSISTGRTEGMMTMEQSLSEMVRAGKITRDTALAHCFRPEDLRRYLQD